MHIQNFYSISLRKNFRYAGNQKSRKKYNKVSGRGHNSPRPSCAPVQTKIKFSLKIRESQKQKKNFKNIYITQHGI